ncbi:hypothetical protein YC2023_061480 [Brassica napus]
MKNLDKSLFLNAKRNFSSRNSYLPITAFSSICKASVETVEYMNKPWNGVEEKWRAGPLLRYKLTDHGEQCKLKT